MKFKIHSYRFDGEPKLSKPKELRGIKQVSSIDFIRNKCRCQVFLKDDDVWIKHKDYFSEAQEPEPHELGMPLNYYAEKYMGKSRPKKFYYQDAWGEIVLRNEAWIVLEDLMDDVKSNKFQLDIVKDIREQQENYHNFEGYSLVSTVMERFWEELVRNLYKLEAKLKE